MNDLGDAKVKVSLDVAEAKRQIAELRKEIRAGHSVVQARPSAQVVRKLARESAGVSGGTGEEKPLTEKILDAAAKRVQRISMANPVSAGVRALGQSAVQGALPESLAGFGRAAGTAAAVYAVISLGSKTQPLVAESLKQILPEAIAGSEVFKIYEDQLEKLRGMVAHLESVVTNAGKAVGETNELWANGVRATGQMPDWFYLYRQNFEVGVAEDDLRKKFDHFKRMEIAGATGRALDDMLKGAVGR